MNWETIKEKFTDYEFVSHLRDLIIVLVLIVAIATPGIVNYSTNNIYEYNESVLTSEISDAVYDDMQFALNIALKPEQCTAKELFDNQAVITYQGRIPNKAIMSTPDGFEGVVI